MHSHITKQLGKTPTEARKSYTGYHQSEIDIHCDVVGDYAKRSGGGGAWRGRQPRTKLKIDINYDLVGDFIKRMAMAEGEDANRGQKDGSVVIF